MKGYEINGWLTLVLGGSLGWKTRGSLVGAFEAVAFELVRVAPLKGFDRL